MARRRFFVDRVHNGHAEISGDDAHHLTRVLRVEKGQRYEISDNTQVWLAEVETAHKGQVSFRTIEAVDALRPVAETLLYAALVKYERLELLIEKGTELGASSIAFFEAERSERGLERAAPKRLERWNRIAREAAEQSRRVRLPEIAAPVPMRDILSLSASVRLLLDEAPGCRPLLHALPADRNPDDRIALLTGPEGGWTDRERSTIVAAGWTPVSLGPGVLRTETAAIAALAIINAAWQPDGV